MKIKNSKVRYGIIGFGSFGERTIGPAIQLSPNSELIAIQKRSLIAAQQKAQAFNVPLAFDSAEKLAAHPDVDAVFIVSANGLHCRETLAAAQSGKHVLVEKPMAVTVREAEEMVAVCNRSSVLLMVGHMVRLSPAVKRIKELIRSGAIGEVRFVKTEFVYDGRDSHRTWLLERNVAGGGPLFDIGVHCLDTMRFILDDDVRSVKAQLHPVPSISTVESTASLSLRFQKGALGSIFCSYEAPVRKSFIEIMGTEGVLAASNFTRSGLNVQLKITKKTSGDEGVTEIEDITIHNLYEEEVTHFSDCILKGMEPSIPGIEGLKNQKVLEAAMTGVDV